MNATWYYPTFRVIGVLSINTAPPVVCFERGDPDAVHKGRPHRVAFNLKDFPQLAAG